jgi:pimeloyl-ACP methyl ester carboxylesterase
MYRACLPLLALSLLLGCYRVIDDTEELLRSTPRAGRAEVAREAEPPQFLRKSSPTLGILTTGLSSLAFLLGFDRDEGLDRHLIRFPLPDGTVVGGLFFPWENGEKGPKPLLIASFGFLQDRFGTEAAKFHEFYVEDARHRLPAHILILDHPTAGIFLGNNGNLSPGSYDDGRMWIEVTRIVRGSMDLASVHLFGVSMSGQTVVHALIEDARLDLGLFASGMAVSIAPDFAVAPGRQLAGIETDGDGANPWREIAPQEAAVGEGLQVHAVRMLVDRQFVPGYRLVRPMAPDYELPTEEIPLVLWDGFEERLAFLRQARPPDWDRAFSRASLPRYIVSTRIAGVIDRVRTPLLLISSEDDPAVASEAFREVTAAAAGNPWVLSVETPEGGHFGFDVPYGAGYLEDLIELMLSPRVLASWTAAPR